MALAYNLTTLNPLEMILEKNLKPLKVAIAGLGVVGSGVYKILQDDSQAISKQIFRPIELVAAASRSKKDFLDPKIKFHTNALDLVLEPEIEVIIETIGGDGVAKDLCEAALKMGKKVITANKMMLAKYGFELSKIAEENGGSIYFEASSAGAIPIIKLFKEAFLGNKIHEFYGILNGTCNFILTKMKNEKLDFSLALKQAQDLGYAELDPAADIKGFDTAHKLTLLAAIASKTKPAFDQIHIEGIEEVSLDDIILADELGYKIKLLAIYKNIDENLQMFVYPALILKETQVAQIDDSFNCILSKTSNAETSFISGRGAGSLPTASSIISDLGDIASERSSHIFSVKTSELKDAKISNLAEREGKYFFRLKIKQAVYDQIPEGSTFLKEIFFEKVEMENGFFASRGESVLCGFLTKDKQKESDVFEIEKLLKASWVMSLVDSFKFFRVEGL